MDLDPGIFYFKARSQGQIYDGELKCGVNINRDSLSELILNRAEQQAKAKNIPWDSLNVNLIFIWHQI